MNKDTERFGVHGSLAWENLGKARSLLENRERRMRIHNVLPKEKAYDEPSNHSGLQVATASLFLDFKNIRGLCL
jgi:hypothetical protein